MRIGIITRKGHPEVAAILSRFLPWLSDRKVEVFMESPPQGSGARPCALEEMSSLVETVVVLGGDGTMLGAARLVAGQDIPLLGVNLGGLGFITEVHKEDLYDATEKILNGECEQEPRMMLEGHVIRNGIEVTAFTALNDVVVSRGSTGKIVDLEASVNGAFVNLFKADGLIVATATGSTAYSLSASGPILYPTLRGILLTPICPHTLTNRPIVLAEDAAVQITLRSESADTTVTCDGLAGVVLERDDSVVIKQSPHVTLLHMPCGRDHFRVLRTKLKWGER
jgi:NAD+ kinase